MAEAASLIASWLTPSAAIFIFVNLVIGTIAITSRFGNSSNKNAQLLPSPELVRTPSLLDRVTSFNLSFHKHEPVTQYVQSENPVQLVRTPSLLERVRSFNLSFRKDAETETQDEAEKPELVRSPSLLERIQGIDFSSLYKSEDPDSGKAEMRKSGSERRGSGLMDREWEEVESRRPQTARAVETASSWKEDEEVDAKADDFINRFKKQLRLQRIDSLLRYRDTLAQRM